MRVKQISVFLENKAGRLVDVCGVMARHEINIRALCIAETADYGVLRLIVSDPDKARDALVEGGFAVSETQVIAVEIPDRPGGLLGALALLRERGVNIEYIYCFVEKSGEKALVVFRVESIEDAIKAFEGSEYDLINEEDVYRI